MVDASGCSTARHHPDARRQQGCATVTASESVHARERFGRYGFRVPCAVVSPWARPAHVSHQVYDHTSILKLVETKWNLPALTYRDANASGLLDMIDLSRPAFAQPPPLARPLLDTDPGALACNVTGPGTIPPPGSVGPPPGPVTVSGSAATVR
jgi:phospholipase C